MGGCHLLDNTIMVAVVFFWIWSGPFLYILLVQMGIEKCSSLSGALLLILQFGFCMDKHLLQKIINNFAIE